MSSKSAASVYSCSARYIDVRLARVKHCAGTRPLSHPYLSPSEQSHDAFDCLVDEPRAPRITVSLLDAAVITAASSDFCVPFGGRPSCHSRIICLRAAGPAATSVGTIQFF